MQMRRKLVNASIGSQELAFEMSKRADPCRAVPRHTRLRPRQAD